jgi:hypothetical protein
MKKKPKKPPVAKPILVPLPQQEQAISGMNPLNMLASLPGPSQWRTEQPKKKNSELSWKEENLGLAVNGGTKKDQRERLTLCLLE